METKGFVQDTDIQRVHSVGYSDGQIAEAVAYIGLATYSNLFNHVYGTELDWPAAPAVDVNEEGANSTRCPTNVA